MTPQPEHRLLEWLTLILQVVLLGAVLAYGQVMGAREAVFRDIHDRQTIIMETLQRIEQKQAGEPVHEQ